MNGRSIFSTAGFSGDSRAIFISLRTLRERGRLRAGFLDCFTSFTSRLLHFFSFFAGDERLEEFLLQRAMTVSSTR